MFLVLIGTLLGAQMLMPVFSDPAIGILIGTLVLMAVYMGWLLSIAVKANHKLENSLKKSPKWMIVKFRVNEAKGKSAVKKGKK
jgi:ABC-type Na+ efflux pump permease subunit